jgi:hypothetical protein
MPLLLYLTVVLCNSYLCNCWQQDEGESLDDVWARTAAKLESMGSEPLRNSSNEVLILLYDTNSLCCYYHMEVLLPVLLLLQSVGCCHCSD